MIRCSLHGTQFGGMPVCDHILQDFIKGITSEIKYLDYIGASFCISCYDTYNLKELEGIEIFDAKNYEEPAHITNLIDSLPGGGGLICGVCFDEVSIAYARKQGNPLPFEPFENTLAHKDQEEIEKLKLFLKNNYKFHKSRHPNSKEEAFSIQKGDIRHPLWISFYYITEEDEQVHLLNMIDEFFKNIPQKQRRISFYESESWIIEERPNGGGVYRGELKLLLEQTVR